MMKLTISFDELATFEKNVDISNYWELTKKFLECQFDIWDIQTAFNFKTLEYDEVNREVSIELITI